MDSFLPPSKRGIAYWPGDGEIPPSLFFGSTGGGLYRYRRDGEVHGHDGQLIHLLQTAVGNDNYAKYLTYSRGLANLPPVSDRPAKK